MATLEEAKKCPKCGEPGNMRTDRRDPNGPRGQRIALLFCENKRCRWYDTSWQITVRPDGSIPDPQEHRGPKQYIGFENHDALANQVQELVRLDELSQQPGTEIRRRG